MDLGLGAQNGRSAHPERGTARQNAAPFDRHARAPSHAPHVFYIARPSWAALWLQINCMSGRWPSLGFAGVQAGQDFSRGIVAGLGRILQQAPRLGVVRPAVEPMSRLSGSPLSR
jgi:hypothetical protein